MYETIALQKNQHPYGAFELKELYPRNYSIGLTIAAIFHGLIIAVYFLTNFMQTGSVDKISTKDDTKIIILVPPRPINIPITPGLTSGNVAKLTKGLPVPVPDALAPSDQTIPSQDEMNREGLAPGESDGGVVVLPPAKPEPTVNDNPDIKDFIPVQQLPGIVVQISPVYPELAIRAGLEGRVWVSILVGREGKPKKAVVVKSDQEIFNQSAIDAAMQYSFTPALQNNKPVAVWVVVPFKFELRGN